jgi:hypothetical protein
MNQKDQMIYMKALDATRKKHLKKQIMLKLGLERQNLQDPQELLPKLDKTSASVGMLPNLAAT